MNLRIASLMVLLVLALFSFSACDNDDDNPTPDPTLYEKLGGNTMVSDPANPGQMIEQGRLGLRSVVDSTIFVIAADPELSPFFQSLLMEVGNGNLSNLAILSKNLTDFFAVATGAESYSYSGLNMKDAHDPAMNPRMAMKADDTDFDNFIGAVVTGANQNNVPSDLINEVGALIETLRSDVVQQ